MKRISTYAALGLLFTIQMAQATTQSTSSWGLDRIDQRGPQLNSQYTYNYEGNGTIIYIVDSGVADVPELEGRIEHRDYVTNMDDISRFNEEYLKTECSAHGTKVATIAAGAIHGVAKNARIVDVRVWDCPVDSNHNIHRDDDNNPKHDIRNMNDFVTAIDDIIARHPVELKGIINLSSAIKIAEGAEMITGAIDRAVAAGLTVVGAATNYFSSACTSFLPSSLGTRWGVITVSSTNEGDQFVTGAGEGPCVDLLAPTGIGASNYNKSAVTFSGTSASAPLVSGAAALVLEQNPWMQPDEVEQLLKDNATWHAINNVPAQTANALLFAALPGVGVPWEAMQVGQTTSAWVTPVPEATYSWSVSNGTIIGSNTGTTVNFSVGCPPQVRPKVSVSTPGGTSHGYGMLNILSTSAHVSGSRTVTYPQSATLIVSLTGKAPWTVLWSDGVQQTFTTAPGTRTVTPTQTKTYRISSVRDGNNCAGTTSGSATITVNGCTPAPSTISAPSGMSASATATASVMATTGATYQWTVTNGMIWSGQGTNSLKYIAGCSGATTVSVTITKSCGTQSQGTASSQISPPTLLVWGSTAINPGETANIAANFNGTMPWSIRWSTGSDRTSNYSTLYQEVAPLVTTTYTATDFRDKRGCTGTISGSATVTVVQ